MKGDTPIYKRKLFVITGGFVVVGMVVALVSLNNNSSVPSSVNVQSAKGIEGSITKTAGTENATKSYNEQLAEHNKERAEQAVTQGVAFVEEVTNQEKAESMVESGPIKIGNQVIGEEVYVSNQETRVIIDDSRIRELELELKRLEIERERDRERTKQMLISAEESRIASIETVNQVRVSEKLQNIESVFSEYAANYRTTTPATTMVTVFNPVQRAEEVSPGNQQGSQQGNQTVQQPKTPSILKPGDMVYAVNKVKINTDYSAKNVVVAEVVSPDKRINGSVAFGSFDMIKDSLVLRFNRIKYPSGKIESIEGYAIDESSYMTSVRSDYDNHYFQRYGLFLAGTFIKGMAEAVTQKSRQGSAIVYDAQGNPAGSTQGNYEMTAEDQLIISGGEVAKELSTVLAKNLDRPPTVTLDYGQTFGILILDKQEQNN